MSDNLTAFEAAEELRVKPATVRHLMRSGRLEASKATGSWLTTKSAIEDFLAAGSNRRQSATRRRRRRAS